jgi:hypothetical protein
MYQGHKTEDVAATYGTWKPAKLAELIERIPSPLA